MKTNKEEIEKGCGMNWNWRGEEVICGIKDGDNSYLCPTCQAILNYNQEIIKMIEERIKYYRKEGRRRLYCLLEVLQKLKGAEK